MRVAANIFWLGGKGSWSTRLREKRGKLPQPRGLVFRRSNPARPEPYQLRRANLLSESQVQTLFKRRSLKLVLSGSRPLGQMSRQAGEVVRSGYLSMATRSSEYVSVLLKPSTQ